MNFKNSKLYARIYAELKYIQLLYKPNMTLSKEINKNTKQFIPIEKQSDKKYIRKIKKDILYSRKVNKVAPIEYFWYQFEKLSAVGRNEYVGRIQLNQFWNKFKSNDAHEIFHDKLKNYEYFKEYYDRDIIKISSPEDKEKFNKFIAKHKRFIAKPIADHQGNGVQIFDENSNLNEVFEELISNSYTGGGIVLEELIVQSSEMAKFHPSSVNTIRFVTFYNHGVLNKILAVIRMGRNGSCIDNACAGGIYATIDMETGIIDSPATSNKSEKYLNHPDTGVQILGAQIPKWKELNELVEKAVEVVPQQKQVGWDFALTDKGWIIVEGNDKPAIQLFFHNRGLKKQIECIYDAYNECSG